MNLFCAFIPLHYYEFISVHSDETPVNEASVWRLLVVIILLILLAGLYISSRINKR